MGVQHPYKCAALLSHDSQIVDAIARDGIPWISANRRALRLAAEAAGLSSEMESAIRCDLGKTAVTPQPQRAAARRSEIWPARPGAFFGRCLAVTSISPSEHRRARQLKCLRSWVAYGLRVIVVNTPHELAGIALPPGVSSVASDDVTTAYDRPTIRINALMRSAVQNLRADGESIAILNSDLEIIGSSEVLEVALCHRDKLTIGVRWNFDGLSEAQIERDGLDFFMLSRQMAESLPDMPYGLGKPFWDYWLPYHFRRNDVAIHWIKSPFLFHEAHETYWSTVEWKAGCDALKAAYGEDMSQTSGLFRRSLD